MTIRVADSHHYIQTNVAAPVRAAVSGSSAPSSGVVSGLTGVGYIFRSHGDGTIEHASTVGSPTMSVEKAAEAAGLILTPRDRA